MVKTLAEVRFLPSRFGLTRIALAGVAAVALVAWLSGRAEASPVPAVDPAAPILRFEPMTHDFGNLRSDTKVTFEWPFHNDGKSELMILGTRPSCGCTASVIKDEAVPPGGTGTLKVTFDPAGQHGRVRKSLAVTSNDPAHPVIALILIADVTAVDLPPTPDGHPRIAGQSLLMGTCAGCHAQPAAGKIGTELWAAACAMCHGANAEGARAPTLRNPDYLASHDDKALALAISYGTANPKMPGFSDVMGGPLNAPQIDSLVQLLRRWGPVRSDAGSAPSPKTPPPQAP